MTSVNTTWIWGRGRRLCTGYIWAGSAGLRAAVGVGGGGAGALLGPLPGWPGPGFGAGGLWGLVCSCASLGCWFVAGWGGVSRPLQFVVICHRANRLQQVVLGVQQLKHLTEESYPNTFGVESVCDPLLLWFFPGGGPLEDAA